MNSLLPRQILPWFLVASLSMTCAAKFDRLESAEQDHFTALKIWMDKKDQKAFFKLKTRADRDAWLKAKGLWKRFYQYDADRREQILAGKVAIGWTKDQVLMAWGPPHSRQRASGRQATRSEVLLYRFEVAEDGTPFVWSPNSKVTHNAIDKYRIELIVDDGTVEELKKLNGWE